MDIKAFFDKDTATVSYVVSDAATKHCAIIDPVLDFNPQSGSITTKSADQLIDYIKSSELAVEWLLETHIHADHLTAAAYIKRKCGGKTCIGEGILEVLKYWVPVFNTAKDTPLDGSQFDHLFKNGETFAIGSLPAKIFFTPGHTPACASYLIGDAVFVGDTVFMPYGGTARADFPGGDAKTLYGSIQKIFALPDSTRVFIAHDYPPEGNAPSWETTVGEQKKNNKMIKESVSEAEYIEVRSARDGKLPVPRLLYPALQINLRAGNLGKPEDNGKHYIRVPLSDAA